MAGRLSRSVRASAVHTNVGMPMTGIQPTANPRASVRARRRGDMPWRNHKAALPLIASRDSVNLPRVLNWPKVMDWLISPLPYRYGWNLLIAWMLNSVECTGTVSGKVESVPFSNNSSQGTVGSSDCFNPAASTYSTQKSPGAHLGYDALHLPVKRAGSVHDEAAWTDRKSTRLNSSH